MKLENVKLNLKTDVVLNVGYPMGATNAPQCYNKLFEVLDLNKIMLPVEIRKGELPEFLNACKLMNIRYLCPTMPHKGRYHPAAGRSRRSLPAVPLCQCCSDR